MALADLLRSLEEDAARELEAVLSQQQHEADAIRASAEVQAASVVAEATQTARIDAERSAQVVLAEARATARALRDRAVHEELQAVHSAARARLADMVGTHAGATATRALLTEGLRLLPTATRVRVDPAHRDVIEGAELHPDGGARYEIAEEPVGVGVIVEDDAGRAVDNTAAVRLDNYWPAERSGLARAWLEATRTEESAPT